MFKVGQKVVCINDTDTIGIEKDKIYKITDISNCKCGCGKLILFINVPKTLKKCSLTDTITGIHSGYKSFRFEPLINDNWVDELLERIKEEIKEEELITL